MMACCDCKIPNILYILKRKRVRKTEKNMVASINNVAAPAATKKTESEIRPHWIWNQTQRNVIEGLVPNHGNGKRGPSKQANKQINEQATKEIQIRISVICNVACFFFGPMQWLQPLRGASMEKNK